MNPSGKEIIESSAWKTAVAAAKEAIWGEFQATPVNEVERLQLIRARLDGLSAIKIQLEREFSSRTEHLKP